MVLLHPKSRLGAVGSGEGQLQGWFSSLSGDKGPGSLHLVFFSKNQAAFGCTKLPSPCWLITANPVKHFCSFSTLNVWHPTAQRVLNIQNLPLRS